MLKLYRLILGLLLFYMGNLQAQCPFPQIDFSNCNYIPVGHRSYSSVYPENTLLSLEELFKRGVKYTEVDVSLTKDGAYVLFHDESSIYRTTSGSGLLRDYTLSQLQLLDVGSWKGEQFRNLRIPTLVDALKLAEKYNAHLYLDTKSYNVPALKATLEQAGVSPNRFLPSISTIEDATYFRSLLPNTPWVWYGAGYYPPNVNDDNFYNQCIQLGCYAFEVSTDYAGDSLWNTFKNKVQSRGAKVWVFTENDNDKILALSALGVDGIESDRPWEAGQLVCGGVTGNPYEPLTTGNWIFEGDLKAHHIGSQIRLLNFSTPKQSETPQFASCNVFGIAGIENTNKVVMRVPGYDSSNGLMIFNNARVEKRGVLDDSYTIIMDLYLPSASTGKWISIYQTNTTNLNDGDLFINPSGAIGINENYHGQVTPNVWNRIAIVLDGANGIIKKYINGVFVGSNLVDPDRWTIWNSSRSGDDQGFLLFADNNGETAELYISALQLRNYAADSATIANLGAPKAIGIKMSNANSWHARLDIAYADSTILDYEHKTFHFVIPADNNADSAMLTFNVYDNATSNINTSKYISTKQPFLWNVTSEDGSRQITWKACVRKAYLGSGQEEDLRSEQKIVVYPNPASSEIHIKNLTNRKSSYQIVDILGKTVQQGSLNLHEDVVNTAAIKQGMYFLVVKQGDTWQHVKLYINN